MSSDIRNVSFVAALRQIEKDFPFMGGEDLLNLMATLEFNGYKDIEPSISMLSDYIAHERNINMNTEWEKIRAKAVELKLVSETGTEPVMHRCFKTSEFAEFLKIATDF